MKSAASPPSSPASAPARLLAWLRRLVLLLWPATWHVDQREKCRAALGAGFGVLCAAVLSRWAAEALGASFWLAAPLGASAVLVFVLPASPLAQPWPVVAGNTLSTLVGALCAMLIPDPALNAGAAVTLAITLMFLLRCLHPPGAAAALLAALGQVDWHVAVLPILADSLLLVCAGVLYNTLTGRPYPHRQRPRAEAPRRSRFEAQDLDAALDHYNQVLNVNREDLQELLEYADASATQRRFGSLRCADIMSREPVSVRVDTPQRDAWLLMRSRGIKALPIVGAGGRLAGIVTAADFLRHTTQLQPAGLERRLRAMLRRNARPDPSLRTVARIMTREVSTARPDQPVGTLIPLFAERGHHHIPVLRGDGRLAGIVTQSDLMRALHER